MLQIINQLYENSEHNAILKTTNGLYYPFDNNWKNIAIAVSGGADSALLAYILCDHIFTNKLPITVHIIHNIRCWKTRPWQKHIADTVINHIKEQFNNIDFKIHYNFVPPDLEHGNTGKTITDEYGKLVSGDTIELRAFTEYVCHNNNIDAYYNAITKNPPIKLNGEIKSRDIQPNEENFKLAVMQHLSFLACHPFRFVDKLWIMNTYFHLNKNDLLFITRSCEGEFNNITYKNYKAGQDVPLCETCFWCKERQWGIENAK